jgi:hypothetical protein
MNNAQDLLLNGQSQSILLITSSLASLALAILFTFVFDIKKTDIMDLALAFIGWLIVSCMGFSNGAIIYALQESKPQNPGYPLDSIADAVLSLISILVFVIAIPATCSYLWRILKMIRISVGIKKDGQAAS